MRQPENSFRPFRSGEEFPGANSSVVGRIGSACVDAAPRFKKCTIVYHSNFERGAPAPAKRPWEFAKKCRKRSGFALQWQVHAKSPKFQARAGATARLRGVWTSQMDRPPDLEWRGCAWQEGALLAASAAIPPRRAFLQQAVAPNKSPQCPPPQCGLSPLHHTTATR